jgi:hypothetical protein
LERNELGGKHRVGPLPGLLVLQHSSLGNLVEGGRGAKWWVVVRGSGGGRVLTVMRRCRGDRIAGPHTSWRGRGARAGASGGGVHSLRRHRGSRSERAAGICEPSAPRTCLARRSPSQTRASR